MALILKWQHRLEEMDCKKEEFSNIQTSFEVPAEISATIGSALWHSSGNGTRTINSRCYKDVSKDAGKKVTYKFILQV